jgi:aerobic carbon-monoxide dehydrogenase small subunit
MNQHAKSISFVLNGSKAEMLVQTHENLVELLNRLDLYGARESCGQGLCGCCTVIVDDIAVSGCLCPAAFVDGETVETIEHLDHDGRLSSVQQAFIDEGAF